MRSGAPATTLAEWPGEAVRSPSLGNYGYLLLRPLAQALRDALARHFAGRSDLSVLDLGCDCKPYFPLFQPYARRYVGCDVGRTRPEVDVVGSASAVPFAAAAFDAVLCSQVLEHVPEPVETLRQIGRALRPGGRLLLSTHGTFIYHPHPTDFWRWTQEGLARIFRDAGCFGDVEIVPNGGTGHCLAYLSAVYLHLGLRRRWLKPLRRVLIPCCNLAGFVAGFLLRRFDHPNPNSLIANFLVVARRK